MPTFLQKETFSSFPENANREPKVCSLTTHVNKHFQQKDMGRDMSAWWNPLKHFRDSHIFSLLFLCVWFWFLASAFMSNSTQPIWCCSQVQKRLLKAREWKPMNSSTHFCSPFHDVWWEQRSYHLSPPAHFWRPFWQTKELGQKMARKNNRGAKDLIESIIYMGMQAWRGH